MSAGFKLVWDYGTDHEQTFANDDMGKLMFRAADDSWQHAGDCTKNKAGEFRYVFSTLPDSEVAAVKSDLDSWMTTDLPPSSKVYVRVYASNWSYAEAYMVNRAGDVQGIWNAAGQPVTEKMEASGTMWLNGDYNNEEWLWEAKAGFSLIIVQTR